jgi:hypothetical protein
VLAQTRRDFEIILVNDGCPDTRRLEAALEPYRSRIRYLTQSNAGPSMARNTGIAAARGRFVAFLDGDDLWEPEFLAAQLDILEGDPNLVLVYSDARPFEGAVALPSLMAREPPSGACDLEALLTGRCVVFTSTTVARRDAVLEVGGFDGRLRRCEDFDLWLRLAMIGSLAYNTRVLGRRRLVPGSLSSSPTAMLEAQIAVRQRFAARLPAGDRLREVAAAADRRTAAGIALVEGRRLLRRGEVGGARRALATAAAELGGAKLAATRALLSLAPPVAIAVERWRANRDALS